MAAAQATTFYVSPSVRTITPFGTGKSTLQFRRGQMIYSQGDSAQSVFRIIRGRVFLNVVSDQGKEAVVSILGEGDFFGESCLVGGEHRSSSAIALEPSTVQRMDRQDLRCNLRSSPEFCEEFMSCLLRRQSQIESDMAQQLFNSSEHRLARILLCLAGTGNAAIYQPIPRISQATLATMVGTTRPRICYFLSKFRQMGLIEGKSVMRIHQLRLERMLASS